MLFGLRLQSLTITDALAMDAVALGKWHIFSAAGACTTLMLNIMGVPTIEYDQLVDLHLELILKH